MKLYDFKKNNLMKYEEDILFYCSSPKTLENYKSNIDDDKNYNFYNDIDSEYYMDCQKQRFKTILSISEPLIKTKKLSNYKKSFCVKASKIEETFEKKIENSNVIRTKLDEYSNKIINEVNIFNVLNHLKELKKIFKNNIIDMENLGLIQFNFIENNLILLLNLIKNKFEQENNTKLLTEFILICIDLLRYFQSSNLYFYIIKNIIQNKEEILENDLNSILDETIIQFFPNNCFDFIIIHKDDDNKDEYKEQDYIGKNNILISNLKDLLIANETIEVKASDKKTTQNKEYNEVYTHYGVKEKMISFCDPNQYYTLNYDNYLFIFFLSFEKIYTKNDYFIYLKIDVIDKKIIHIGKIKLFDNESKKEIVDLNISIKNELIFILYIYNNADGKNSTNERILKYNIYSANDMDLLESKNIIYEKNLKPFKIFNDSKYFYCFLDLNKVLMIKKTRKLDNIKYINFSIRLYDINFIYKTTNTNINDFQMFNSLCFNNLFVIENKYNKQKYIGKFLNKKNNNYILNIFYLKGTNSYNIKITYNNYKFIVTHLREEIKNGSKNTYNIYMKMTSLYRNDLIDKNIKLLPFNKISYNNNYPDNLYEYLLQEYSTFLNLCGNFDLVNIKKEHNLIKFPFYLCCNFEQNNLDFLIKTILVNNECTNINLYYIMIIKQIICCLYNGDIFIEEQISDLINYFNKLILNHIKK